MFIAAWSGTSFPLRAVNGKCSSRSLGQYQEGNWSLCFRGGRFPLSLPVVFPALFGENPALLDAQQSVLMANLFLDLCKPPHQRAIWPGSGVTMGSGKRQRSLKFFQAREQGYLKTVSDETVSFFARGRATVGQFDVLKLDLRKWHRLSPYFISYNKACGAGSWSDLH
jgi:hypothetical protein